MVSGIPARLKRTVASALVVSFLIAPLPAPRPAYAATYLSDTASHPPPSSGSYAYYATAGTFGPDQAGFPAIGGSFVEPVFGGSIKRLTNELGQQSFSEIYAKNGFQNADGTLMHHRAPDTGGGRLIISTVDGHVVRTNVPGNFDSSFAPDDPDAWYWFSWGGTALNKYKVSTGTSTHGLPPSHGTAAASAVRAAHPANTSTRAACTDRPRPASHRTANPARMHPTSAAT